MTKNKLLCVVTLLALGIGGCPSNNTDTPDTGTDCAGVVPHVTCGSISEPSRVTTVSKVAPSSVGNCFHAATACSHASPCGA